VEKYRMNFSIEWHDRLDSTNAVLKERMQQNATIAEGTVISAREQTRGRGRSNRTWTTVPNTNLCFSVFLKTDCPLIEIPSLTMAVALGISDFLNGQRIPAAPKWPNDVLVGNKKICGILSERVEYGDQCGIIVGIGLNVNMSPEEAAAIDRPATSMQIETGEAADLEKTLANLLPHVDQWLGPWKDGGFAAIRDEWTQKAGPIGKPICVHDGNIRKSGTLAGFGRHGELLLQSEIGLETIWSGDVS
jgi:BirA family biotin operon repressor/biotin-[acetyl-CoA-carboxylase] ligase